MKIVRPALPAAALLAALVSLAACSAADDAPADTTREEATEAPADNGPLPQAELVIPEPMLGAWDYVEGTCDLASDLRLEIRPEELLFYESHGMVQSVEQNEAGDEVTVSLAMSGEGEEWEEQMTLRLVEGGTLLETDTPSPSGEGMLRRKRCQG